MKELQIGNVTLKNRYILAPMAGVCDLPFRLLCREMGAGLTCMEMVSAKAIFYDNKKTFGMLHTSCDEHPVSLQFFGNEPELMAQMVKKIEDYPIDIIDINMGCPVLKVVKNKEGSALLKNPVLAGKIIEAMVGATTKPVTVKIRIGFDDSCINAVEIAKIAQESGAAAITVHGRTREQFYEGEARWDVIADVKNTVNIPVIGNGNIFDIEDVMGISKITGCDGFAIGRGARGNPWLFKRLVEYENTGIDPGPPTMEEVAEMMKRHFGLLVKEKGEYIGVREMRKHAAWYLSGRKNASKVRGQLNTVESAEAFYRLIEGLV